MIHYLKIEPVYLNRVIDGSKTFEVRKNDRNFQERDILVLQEYENSNFLGREIEVEITYVLKEFDGLKDGYVVLGIETKLSYEGKIKEQIEIIKKEIRKNAEERKIIVAKQELLMEIKERLESLLDTNFNAHDKKTCTVKK